MDWTDFVFPAKHVMDAIGSGVKDLAAHGKVTTNLHTPNSANLDIGKMAQDQANKDRPDMAGVSNHQLSGAGGQSQTPCPTCGK